MSADVPRTNRILWVVIGVLSVALVAAGIALMSGGDGKDSGAAPAPPSTPAPPSPSAPASTSTSAPATRASPFAPDPKEAAARERLLVLSHALDLWFRQHYEFPDRLEVLIANDLARPAELSDPWNRPVDYTLVAKARFKLCSRGADATSYTDDDVCIGPGGREERAGR